jgi:hypothetical protein
MGKLASKDAPAPAAKARKAHRLPKVRKVTDAERREAVEGYCALLEEARKTIKFAPGTSVEWMREDRAKDDN